MALGEGGDWGAPKSYKNNSVPQLCHYDSKALWNRGGGALGALKSYKMIMAYPLSVIEIVNYCGQKCTGNADRQYNCILPVTN